MKSLFSRFKSAGTTTTEKHTGHPPVPEKHKEKITVAHPHPVTAAIVGRSDRDSSGGGGDRTVRVSRSRSLLNRRPSSRHAVRTPTPTTAAAAGGTGEASDHHHSHHHHEHHHHEHHHEHHHHPRPTTPGPLQAATPVPQPAELPERKDSLLLSGVEPATTATTLDDTHLRAHWDLESPRRRMSSDNIKKVAFQSPARAAEHSSETDLRSRMEPAPPRSTSRAHVRRVSSPRRSSVRAASPSKGRAASPTRQHRSPTPTSRHIVQRPSSRASNSHSHLRKTSSSSVSASGVSHSPTKSTLSSLAPSDASTMSAESYLPQPESWSAAMDDELVANLGPRERARQEVLWEIVHSEERYVPPE